MVEVKVSGDELQRVQQRLGLFRSKAPVVLSKAINSAVNRAKKNVVKDVTDRYAVDGKELQKAIRSKRSKPAKLSGQVTVQGGRLALSKFLTDPMEPEGNRPKFYSAAVLKSDGFKPLTGGNEYSKGFLVRFESGHKAMVERRTGTKNGAGREKLLERMGLSFPEMAGQRDVAQSIQEEAYRLLQQQIDKQVKKAMEGKI